MCGDNKLTAFASGNGDTVLIEAHRKTILTDIHYRQNGAEDDDNDEVPDFAPDIRAACPNHHLSIFVLTHPDKDHLGGAEAIFHLGPPGAWDPDPRDGEPKIIMDEIWCSPYAVDPHYVTEQSEPMINEIKRRYKLRGTPEGAKDGNRLVVMDASTHPSGAVVPGLIEWRLLAPMPAERDIPEAPEGESPTSSNPTSLVIRWTVTVGGARNYILIGGDATVEVLERIERQIHRKAPDDLAWHILLALHHCSRRSIGRVYNDNHDDEEFEESDAALKALGEQRGNGYVISSSRRVKCAGSTPPSFHAKNRYLKILAGAGEVTDAVRARFLCTGGNEDGDKPEHVIFHLTAAGPTKPQRPKSAAIVAGVGTSSVGRGGGYG